MGPTFLLEMAIWVLSAEKAHFAKNPAPLTHCNT